MTAAEKPSSYGLAVDDVDAVPVQVVRLAHLTLLQWIRGTASPQASLHPVSRAVLDGLSPRGRQVLPALGMPGLDRLPDLLTSPAAPDESVAAYLERLRRADPARLAAEIDELWQGRPPRPWRDAARRPGEWLQGAAVALSEVWTAGRAHWHAADLLFRREEARVGQCAVTGTLHTMLNGIDPRIRAGSTGIEFVGHCAHRATLGSRRFVLAPTLTTTGQVIVGFDDPALAYIAYPLPGLDGRADPARSTDRGGDALATLLGPIRAAALRALEQPQTMNVLARTVHVSPSTLTHHCDQLLAAGLLRRDRHGRSMWVSRTDRALRLIELMSAPAPAGPTPLR